MEEERKTIAGLSPNTAALMAYLLGWVTGLLFLALEKGNGYVRFHGRNAARWWEHEQAYERYDYTYSQEELQEWVPKIRELDAKAENTFLFANNHWQGQAVHTACSKPHHSG